jgi:raffinose/stachyose/melibiose transport system permease protein
MDTRAEDTTVAAPGEPAVSRWAKIGRPRVSWPTGINIPYVLRYIILLAVAAAVLLPLVYGILGGAKTNQQLVGDPVSLIPAPWTVSNYTDVLFGPSSPDFWHQLLNSLMVAAVAVSFTVIAASLAAFTFARMVFRGREAIYTFFVMGLLFPAAVAILPLFILLRQLDLNGSLLGVALPEAAFGLPLSIIILRPFFKSIPVELEDAAKIDGCSNFGFMWRVLLPLSRPALATVSVLAFVGSWNAFMLPLIILDNASTWTLPLGVMNFQGQYTSDKALVLAYTVTAAIPAVVFYFFAERQLVGGLTGGAVKG